MLVNFQWYTSRSAQGSMKTSARLLPSKQRQAVSGELAVIAKDMHINKF
jgi:hypothetical protein